MSTFTNGPCCGPGGTLPQEQTLQDLLSRINAVQGQIGELRTQYLAHTDVSTSGSLHYASVTDLIDALDTSITNIMNGSFRTNVLATAAADATNKANTAEDKAKAFAATSATTAQTNANTYTNGQIANLKAQDLAALQRSLNVLSNELDGLLAGDLPFDVAITGKLTALNTKLKQLKVEDFIDFVHWAQISGWLTRVISAVSERNNKLVILLGALSKEYIADQTWATPTLPPKPFRAYIEFIDTRMFSAIVDGTVTPRYTATLTPAFNCSLMAQVSKTQSRVTPVTFGLYQGTVTSGDTRIYLGVTIDEINNKNVQTTFGWTTALKFLVTGENFIPLNADNFPSGAVTERGITIIDGSEGSVAFDRINAQAVMTDNLIDSLGHPVITVADDHESITFGNDTHDILLKGPGQRPQYINPTTQVPEDLMLARDLNSSVRTMGSAVLFATVHPRDGVGGPNQLPANAILSISSDGSATFDLSAIDSADRFALVIPKVTHYDDSTADGYAPQDATLYQFTIAQGTSAITYTPVADVGAGKNAIPITLADWVNEFDPVKALAYHWYVRFMIEDTDTFYHQGDITWAPFATNPVAGEYVTVTNLVLEDYYNREEITHLLEQTDAVDGMQPDWWDDRETVANARTGLPTLNPSRILHKPMLMPGTLIAGDYRNASPMPTPQAVVGGDYRINSPIIPPPPGTEYKNAVMRQSYGVGEPPDDPNTDYALKYDLVDEADPLELHKKMWVRDSVTAKNLVIGDTTAFNAATADYDVTTGATEITFETINKDQGVTGVTITVPGISESTLESLESVGDLYDAGTGEPVVSTVPAGYYITKVIVDPTDTTKRIFSLQEVTFPTI